MIGAATTLVALVWLVVAVGNRLAGRVPEDRPATRPREGACPLCPLVAFVALDQVASAHQCHADGVFLAD